MLERETAGEMRLPVKAAVLQLWRDSRREFTLPLEGRSMVPLAAPGDRVTIRSQPPEELRGGEIIALQQGETLVVHRFLMARTADGGGRWYCQKGDNSPAWGWVPPESVLGQVVAVSGPGGRLDLTRRPWTWFNALAGRLGRWRVLLAGGGGGRVDGPGFRNAVPRARGLPGRLGGRLRRGLVSLLLGLYRRR